MARTADTNDAVAQTATVCRVKKIPRLSPFTPHNSYSIPHQKLHPLRTLHSAFDGPTMT